MIDLLQELSHPKMLKKLIYHLDKSVYAAGMTTTPDIRRENARALAKSVGGPANFGRRMDMSISQVSQIIGRSATRNIGNAMARKMEGEFGLPVGWMDVRHSEAADEPVAPIYDGHGQATRSEYSNAELADAVRRVRDPAQRTALITLLRAFGVLESN